MKKVMFYLMVLLYIAAGINHFIHPQIYISITPPWLPSPAVLVFISGVCEILFALLLLFTATRKLGAWLIILLLIAVFPANIQMMLNYMHEKNPFTWITILRLPLQLLLIWWAYTYTKSNDN